MRNIDLGLKGVVWFGKEKIWIFMVLFIWKNLDK